MKFTLTINSDDASEVVAAVTALAMIGINSAASSEVANLTEGGEVAGPLMVFPGKPIKQRTQKKPKFEDPGDKDPFANTVPPSANTSTDPFGDTPASSSPAVQTDDFGDPIAPTTPKLTLDMLRAEMQSKSIISPEMKEKCKALVKSYNVEALGMIGEDKYPEVLAKIKAL